MKRIVILVLGLVVVIASAITAEAGPKKRPKRVERTVEGAYQVPTLGSPSTGQRCLEDGSNYGCDYMHLGSKDRFVRMLVSDLTGTGALFYFSQDIDSEHLIYGPFCGTTGDEPVPILAPGVEIHWWVVASGEAVCPGGVATTGTVEAVFSNLP